MPAGDTQHLVLDRTGIGIDEDLRRVHVLLLSVVFLDRYAPSR
jgi:hypothetical protein